jgi:hypothetical protein
VRMQFLVTGVTNIYLKYKRKAPAATDGLLFLRRKNAEI